MKIQNRNKSTITNRSRRLAALLCAGVCVAGTEARADIIVSVFTHADRLGNGLTNGLDLNPWFAGNQTAGLEFDTLQAFAGAQQVIDKQESGDSFIGWYNGGNASVNRMFWQAGDDPSVMNSTKKAGRFTNNASTGYIEGAQAGPDNYALVSFLNSNLDAEHGSGAGGVASGFEAVVQFHFSLIEGESYVKSVAISNTSGGLTLAQGVAAIPEPSGALLSLLALGSTTMFRRRGRPSTHAT